MGRRGAKRGFGGRGRGRGRGGGGGGARASVRTDREIVPTTNALFEAYYNGLELFDEQEREQFWAALRRELPNSFRFTGSKGHALQVQKRMVDLHIPEITSINFEDQPVPPPTQLTWFPDQLAWQMTTPKSVIRRFPPFASFQKFLVSETAVGNISRQEVVSMIPPLFMDVKPGMTVLDLCAAPGSKSAQLIEMIHGGEESRVRKILRDVRIEEGREPSPDDEAFQQDLQKEAADGDWSDDGRSTGLLIANDVDWKRAQLLIHQMKRLSSPNLMVTNHDAAMFPSIKLKSLPVQPGQAPKNRYLKFDRVLADVPCSGDGTARKNYSVWKEWSPSNGLGLHVMQVRILVRALQMLKVGGRAVYSTCSMNPVENEAVVAAAIDRCGGVENVELIDCSAAYPGLRRAPGLTSWKVIDKYGELWPSWDEVVAAQEESFDDYRAKITTTMFPPDSDSTVPLRHCMRIYPHLQDTGGFFIAVLEKRREIKARPEITNKPGSKDATASATADSQMKDSDTPGDQEDARDEVESQSAEKPDADASAVSDAPSPKKRKLEDEAEPPQQAKRPAVQDQDSDTLQTPAGLTGATKPGNRTQQVEEPFKYLDPEDETIRGIYDFYGLGSRFPRDRFVVRNSTGVPSKKIYYSSTLVKEILVENEARGIKFVHGGILMFVRQDVQSPEICRWRIQTDGLPLIETWVSEERAMRLKSRKVFRKLLIEMFPKVTGHDGWPRLGELGPRARDIKMGCCVLRIEKSEGEDGFSERMVFPVWRSLHSLNLMLPKEDRRALLLRLYNEDTPLTDHHLDRTKKGSAKPSAPEPVDSAPGAEALNLDDAGTTSEEDEPAKDKKGNAGE